MSYDEVYRVLKTAFKENSVTMLHSYQQYLPISIAGEEQTANEILNETLIRTRPDDKGNVVKVRSVVRNRTPFLSGTQKDTYVPNAAGDSYEVTKKEFISQGKRQKRNVTLAKAATNLSVAGAIATPIALLNRKRIARGISKLNEKLKYYKDKRNSGPIVAKIKQMIRKLQAKLNQKLNK